MCGGVEQVEAVFKAVRKRFRACKGVRIAYELLKHKMSRGVENEWRSMEWPIILI